PGRLLAGGRYSAKLCRIGTGSGAAAFGSSAGHSRCAAAWTIGRAGYAGSDFSIGEGSWGGRLDLGSGEGKVRGGESSPQRGPTAQRRRDEGRGDHGLPA